MNARNGPTARTSPCPAKALDVGTLDTIESDAIELGVPALGEDVLNSGTFDLLVTGGSEGTTGAESERRLPRPLGA